jgi:hypothetical protein
MPLASSISGPSKLTAIFRSWILLEGVRSFFQVVVLATAIRRKQRRPFLLRISIDVE